MENLNKLKFWDDKVFMKSMTAIAIPIALQNLITSSLNMVDTLMISNLGQTSIAAVGLANQVFFFFSLIIFGITSGASIFISQYWGRRDIPNVRKSLGISIVLSFVIGVIFTIAGFFFPEKLMALFLDNPEVIRQGADYLKIVSLSYIITGVGTAYGTAMRSTGRPNVPMRISAVSFITNTVFNYLLIFGKFGFPEMGVKGAALGTLIARIVEIVFVFYAIYSDISDPLAADMKDIVGWDMQYFKRIMITISPVIINETFWSLGQVLYSVAYARIGEQAAAAVQLTTTIQNIFYVLIRGLSNACAVMVGSKIGEGDKEEAYEYAIKFLVMSTVIGLVLGLLMAATSGLTIKLFGKAEPELKLVVKDLLKIVGYALFIKAANSTIVVGILRGGGDTKFSLFAETGSVWLVGVPLAFIGALVWKLPVEKLLILVLMEEVVKFIVGVPRVISKKWMKDLTTE